MSVTSGWGRLTWNQANWNEATTLKTGWGAQSWSGEGGWGDLSDQTISLTGLSITSSIGSVDVPDQVITPTGQFLLGFFYFNEPFSTEKFISFIIIWIAVFIYLKDLYEKN